MNHILLRLIDKKKENFFIKCHNSNTKSDIIKLKDKFRNDKFHELSNHNCGNVFDYEFYNGYYFNTLFQNKANFFFDVKNMNNIDEYNKKFNIMMSEKKANKKLINKFRNLEDEVCRCARSHLVE